MAVRFSASEATSHMSKSALSPNTAVEGFLLKVISKRNSKTVFLKGHDAAAGAVGGAAGGAKHIKKRCILPPALVALLLLGLSGALVFKMKREQSLPSQELEQLAGDRRAWLRSFLGVRDSPNSRSPTFHVLEEPRRGLIPSPRLLLEGRKQLNWVESLSLSDSNESETPPTSIQAKRLRLTDWGLPSVEQVQDRMSCGDTLGQQYLARLAGLVRDCIHPRPSPKASAALTGLARILTAGKTDDINGVFFVLKSTRPLDWDFPYNTHSGLLEVTGFLGEGGSRIVLDVIDHSRGVPFALVLRTKSKDNSWAPAQLAKFLQEDMDHEESVMLKACGNRIPLIAAQTRGIKVPMLIGDIPGIKDVEVVGSQYIFKRAYLMERLEGGDISVIATSEKTPQAAKVYIAKHLLLYVLLLQEAGVSHNDLSWNNCHLRSDGTFILGGLECSSHLGHAMYTPTRVTPVYVEPSLLIDYAEFLSGGEPPTPDPKSDMWSMGALLFELFTDGNLPYDLMENRDSFTLMRRHLETLIANDVSPNALDTKLQVSKVPLRWRELIKRMLEPKRKNRISPRNVARDFADILEERGL